ncbi:hypothetical protein [Massilia glaciei]|uniref:Uncharacterized protein n=1 Tax=Massilia glaciei TaxID=1524097 RepID=A0A2U2HMC1_9BURK|nr:hypothetical protein [Massilia glaciei]PWF48668.1 hypothetical protein C7C56_010685 [Massilia glaciei]
MTARQTLVGFMLLLVAVGMVDAHIMESGLREAPLMNMLQWLALSYMLFSWYCSDGNARGYVRSRWLSMAVVFGAFLAIPYYLVRSRAPGKRLMALLRFGGLCALAFGALLLGMVVRMLAEVA